MMDPALETLPSVLPALPESALSAVLAHPGFPSDRWRLVSFKGGDVILREGHHSNRIYMVHSGTARVEGTVKLQNGRQFQAGVTKLEAGEIFGELAMFDHQPHSASVFAHTDATIAAIDGEALLTFLEQHKMLGYEVFKDLLYQLAPRLRATSARVYRFLAWGLKAYHLDQ